MTSKTLLPAPPPPGSASSPRAPSGIAYAFTETVTPHEPASAADWALTLPPSQECTELLQNIHRHWQGKDEDTATAFAPEQGLSPAQPSGTNLIDPWHLPAIKLPPATSSLLLPQL